MCTHTQKLYKNGYFERYSSFNNKTILQKKKALFGKIIPFSPKECFNIDDKKKKKCFNIIIIILKPKK